MPETSFGRFGFQWDNTYQTKNDLYGTVGEYNGAPTWRLRSNLTTTWQMGDFDASWTARYYSGMAESCIAIGCTDPDRYQNGESAPIRKTGSNTFHDLQFNWQAPWNATIAVGQALANTGAIT